MKYNECDEQWLISDIKTGASYNYKSNLQLFYEIFYFISFLVLACNSLNQSSNAKSNSKLLLSSLIVSALEVPIIGRILAGCFKIKANRIWFSSALYFSHFISFSNLDKYF